MEELIPVGTRSKGSTAVDRYPHLVCYPGGTAACWVTEGNEGVRVDGLPAGTQAIAYGDSYARRE